MPTATQKTKEKQGKPSIGFSDIKALSRPDSWAADLELRVDGRPFSLDGREYVIQPLRDEHDHIVVPKAAQMSFTITFLVKTLHRIVEKKKHGAYILPIKIGAVPFVQGRIDPIIDSSDRLRQAFSYVDNKLHKQTVSNINFYVRGTNIQRELQEFPVDFMVWDERDRFVEDYLADAIERMSGSTYGKLIELSTPTIPGFGITADDTWDASDQHEWEIPCPGCSRYQVLTRKDHLIIGEDKDDCRVECIYCHRAFKDYERRELNKVGRWVPHNLNGRHRGYHISQLNSPVRRLDQIMDNYFKGQDDAKKLESWYNNGFGEPYVAAGNRVTPELLDQCRAEYVMGGLPPGPVFVGVDVGTKLHVKCDYLDRDKRRIAWRMLILNEWDDLDKFFSQLHSFVAVIDAHPEKRAARDLAMKYHGKVWIGFEQDRPAFSEIADFRPLHFGEAGKVNIDRTMAFDQVIARMMNGRYVIPKDARELGEYLENKSYNGYYAQMCEMARREEEDAQGRMRAFWKKTRNPDHWHHADMFAEIASMRAPTLVIPGSVGSMFREAGAVIG